MPVLGLSWQSQLLKAAPAPPPPKLFPTTLFHCTWESWLAPNSCWGSQNTKYYGQLQQPLSLICETVTRALPQQKTRRLHVLKLQQAVMHSNGLITETCIFFRAFHYLLFVTLKPAKLLVYFQLCLYYTIFWSYSFGPISI